MGRVYSAAPERRPESAANAIVVEPSAVAIPFRHTRNVPETGDVPCAIEHRRPAETPLDLRSQNPD
jgi:hypothetical protein